MDGGFNLNMDKNIQGTGEVPLIVIDSSDSSLDVSVEIISKRSCLSETSPILGRGSKRRKVVDEFWDSTTDTASNDETEEDLVERVMTMEMDEAGHIAQDNINHVEDHACNSVNIEKAISPAQQENEIGNIDPMIVQARALGFCGTVAQALNDLDRTMLSFKASNNLLTSTAILKEKLKDIMAEIERIPLTEPVNIEQHSVSESNTANFQEKAVGEKAVGEKAVGEKAVGEKAVGEKAVGEKAVGEKAVGEKTVGEKAVGEKAVGEKAVGEKAVGEKAVGEKAVGEKAVGEKAVGEKAVGEKAVGEKAVGEKAVGEKAVGEKAAQPLEKEQALIIDTLENLRRSLARRPSKEEKGKNPQGLKPNLVSHQQHALAWMLWREEEKCAGGVLADGIGLGKTLTMISLILATTANKKSKVGRTENRTLLQHQGGTLLVCPASQLPKWEREIKNRCKEGILSVHVHHGRNREKDPKRLAKYDVVLTTYQILISEFKLTSILYKILWERVTLDKAEIILEYQNQATRSVCDLVASKRWALTATPIQDLPMNFYSILKFLKFSLFDDVRVWKYWVDNVTSDGQERLKTIMATFMLRRTKGELLAKDELECFPAVSIKEVVVNLDSEEKSYYEECFIYVRSAVDRLLAHLVNKYYKAQIDKNAQFTMPQNKLLSSYLDVEISEVCVLLLRLQQICDHPSLIRSKFEEEFIRRTHITNEQNLDRNLLSHINSITSTNDQEMGVDRRVVSNSVLRPDRISSKVKMVLGTVKKILQQKDKLIIASQWTAMLKIVSLHLPSIKGATFSKLEGNAPLKERQRVIDSFNAVDRNPKILLLSLTADGVDLNLTGGNHLLLIDINWNPQLEAHAEDWIYRMGQKKDIFIYKFICKDTIEQQIQILHEKKLEIAENGPIFEARFEVVQLTCGDLKFLFAL